VGRNTMDSFLKISTQNTTVTPSEKLLKISQEKSFLFALRKSLDGNISEKRSQPSLSTKKSDLFLQKIMP
jgi:hypothetical protein